MINSPVSRHRSLFASVSTAAGDKLLIPALTQDAWVVIEYGSGNGFSVYLRNGAAGIGSASNNTFFVYSGASGSVFAVAGQEIRIDVSGSSSGPSVAVHLFETS